MSSVECGEKSYTMSMHLKKIADTHFKQKKFLLSLEYYTKGLMYAMPIHLNEKASKCQSEDFLVAILYSGRSAVSFRLKRYEECIADIKRAFANGKHTETRYIELMNRLSWSYWHLKEYDECSNTVEAAMNKEEGKNCKELDILRSMIIKSKAKILSSQDNKPNKTSKCKNELSPHELEFGESEEIKGASSCAVFNVDEVKGRYLTTKTNIRPGSNLISEEAYCGLLNNGFLLSYCNYCFKGNEVKDKSITKSCSIYNFLKISMTPALQECKLTGIPCYGCSKALFCNEDCRLIAWQTYHWLECSMWPVLQVLDCYAHLSLRTLLCAAHDYSSTVTTLKPEKGDHCSFIAGYLQSTFTHSDKTKNRKKAPKKANKTHFPILDGRNQHSGSYKGDYWSIFCLQTHESEQTKVVLTKCALYATYLARVLNQCFLTKGSNKHKKVSNGLHSETNSVSPLNCVKSAFHKMSLKGLLSSNQNAKNSFDFEVFREKVMGVCKSLSSAAPYAKIKHQSCFLSKELPQTFQEIVAFFIKRHMLQLHTNCQAIYDIIPDENQENNNVSSVSQQRVASAFFPSTSLLNHSCSANTMVSFSGRRILVKAIQNIQRGSELAHCYGPCISRHSFNDRQRALKEQYFFNCDCSTCAKYKSGDTDQQAFLQQFTAYKCKDCDGPILILERKDANDGTIFGKCANEGCKHVYDLSQSYRTYNNLVNMSNSTVQQSHKLGIDVTLETLEKCLVEMKKILYHNHYAISSIHDQLGYYYSQKKEYKKAIAHITASLKVVSMKYGAKSLEAAREMYKLSTLYLNCNMITEAQKFLKKSLEIYKCSLAPNSEELSKAESMFSVLNAYNLGPPPHVKH